MIENLIVRELEEDDIVSLLKLDHDYDTDYVWQMDISRSNDETNVKFKQVRLPRSMQVEYPQEAENLIISSSKHLVILAAVVEGEIIGYVNLNHRSSTKLVNIFDLVIARRFRKQGFGSILIEAARVWAIKQGADRITIEMQSKNFPGISLALKLGFEFCGYSDRYYDNQDIALFFSKRI